MGISASQRKFLSLVAAVLVAVGAWWFQQGTGDGNNPADRRPQQSRSSAPSPSSGSASTPAGSASPSGSSSSSDDGVEDPESGLTWVDEDELPTEARQTLDLIDEGGPYPYDRDGVTFENREGILPSQQRGHYHEYTVPTPGEDDRGARRIVTGDEDEFFWTADHYASFERIRR
ncbi:hypothetical protein ncot_06780 [Nocardioides sp. JQ2195]|uniref:ribonuclease domain-containing protein n=1 Tax=Nocardioides sp. JQ2195 TaxID=2592334 RepID=UPI00143E5BBC|nr:ribonuclease domain-containing protein [Nocardioides sp. JQ2195]QIX26336.1 hypothetical protein ncot_06780 [Nocardioides sp. JQ2195]